MVKKSIGNYLKLLAVTGLAIFLVHVSSVKASDSAQHDEVTGSE